jgi:protein-S-isoprenylcysteine O-methyltransferase Ste14
MLKVILLIYTIGFYGIVFFWRTIRTWRETGINAYQLAAKDSVQGLAGKIYRLISFSSVGAVFIFVFWDSVFFYLTPITWLEISWLSGLGLVLLFASLPWILVAQVNMGNAWRIGIDNQNPTELVTSGVFQISRNPIFLGMRLNLMGLFLVLPNAITLLTWLIGDVMLRIQVLLEEDHLAQIHGESYQDYKRSVRRWF